MGNIVYKATLVPKNLGGFGQDVSTGLTNDNVAIVSGNAITLGPLTATALPSAIDAAKIANGTVSNTEFQYLDGVTSLIQTQINAKLDSSSSRLPPVPSGAGNMIYDNGTSYVALAAGTTSQVLIGGSTPSFGNVPSAALTSIPAGNLIGTVAEANGGYGMNASTIGTGLIARTAANTYTARTITQPAAGITITNGSGVSGDPTLALANDLSAIEGLSTTGIAIRTATDTWTNRSIASGTGTTVTNGDGVAGNPSINVTYGSGSNTATQGNDTRLPPAPSIAGKIIYDTGTAYAAATAGTTSQVLVGGTTPAFGSVPTAALPTIPENKGGLGSDTSALGAGILTKTATNTYTVRSIANGTGTTVTNGAGTAGNPSINVTYGATSNTATQGNDTRLNPTPASAGNIIYDTGSAYSSATAGTSSQVLIGGSVPAFGNVPSAALTSIPAGNLTGTVAEARGGTGMDSSTIGTGLVTRTAANTYTARSLTAPAAGITVTNPAGTAGNPTLVLANDLSAVEGLSGTGLAVRTTTDTWTNRSLVAGTGTTVTNGDGVSGNLSVNVTYGSASSTATQGNDTRLPPTPSGAGKIIYDNGSAYAALAAGSSSQVLFGGTTPSWGSVTHFGSADPMFWNAGTISSTLIALGIGGAASSATTTVIPWIAPCAGTLKNMTMYTRGSGGAFVATLYSLTASATTTLTVTAPASGNAASQDSTHTVSVSNQDTFCIQFSGGASISCISVTIVFQFIPSTG